MIIIIDTREKTPWNFLHYTECNSQTVQCLKEGDYSILGLENQVRIERKRSTSELANNLGQEWERFRKECVRLISIPHKYVICEFSLEDILLFPKRANIPKNKLKYVRMNGKFMMHRINELEETTGVKFIFCNNKHEAEQEAYKILHNVYIENQS